MLWLRVTSSLVAVKLATPSWCYRDRQRKINGELSAYATAATACRSRRTAVRRLMVIKWQITIASRYRRLKIRTSYLSTFLQSGTWFVRKETFSLELYNGISKLTKVAYISPRDTDSQSTPYTFNTKTDLQINRYLMFCTVERRPYYDRLRCNWWRDKVSRSHWWCTTYMGDIGADEAPLVRYTQQQPILCIQYWTVYRGNQRGRIIAARKVRCCSQRPRLNGLRPAVR